MWSDNPAVFDHWGCCVKCTVLATLEDKVSELEFQLRSLRHLSQTAAGPAANRAPPQEPGFTTVRKSGKRNFKSSNPKRTPEFIDPNRFQVLDEWRDGDPDANDANESYASVSPSPAPAPKYRNSASQGRGGPRWTRQTLVIGSSIVRDVILPEASTRCYPGARLGDIEGNLRLLKKSNNRYRRIVIHAGGNDTRRGQSEVTKLQVEAVCTLAKSMCDEVVFSGPLPDFSTSEMFSRFSAFHSWLATWCPANHIGFVDNWTAFEGIPGLIRRDGIHPTRAGSLLLAHNMLATLQ